MFKQAQVKMSARKSAPKISKEERQQMNLKTQLDDIPADFKQVDDEHQSALIAMEFLIPNDIIHRRMNKLPDLLTMKEIETIIKDNNLTALVDGETDLLKILRKLEGNPGCAKFYYFYNIQLVALSKSKEIEIRDGKKCKRCGKLSCVPWNVQLAAGDEGTGRVLKCTNPKCNDIAILSRK